MARHFVHPVLCLSVFIYPCGIGSQKEKGRALLVLTCLCPAILLPFTFKYGVEKGRFAYYITIGICCGVGAFLVSAGFEIPTVTNSFWLLGAVAGVSILLYALSWRLSIRFYQKREL